MRNKKSEMWVGVFVVIGVILLISMTLKIERFRIWEKTGYLLHIYFDSATGLEQNSPVKVAGVHLGNVEKIVLEQEKAKVTFRLPSEVVLYKDAKAYVKAEGILGEKYIEITPGTPGLPKIGPDSEIEQGSPPVDVEQVLSKMGDIGEDFKSITKPLGDILKAVDTKKLEGMIQNFSQFSNQLGGIASDSKEIIRSVNNTFSSIEDIGEKVKKGEGTLGKLITDETIYQDAKKTVETAKEVAESVKVSIDALKNVSEKIEKGEGTLGKLIQDESLYQEVKDTVKSAKETMESADEALRSVKGIAEKLERGEGTLGKLVSDDQLMKEAEKTMKKVQKAAEGIEEQTPITVLGTIFGLFF